MRVAIVNLTRGGFSGGYIKYLRALIPRLALHPEIEHLEVFVPSAAHQRFAAEPWPVRTWPADAVRPDRELRRVVEGGSPDVVFIPTARWLSLENTPTVVMVRNMEPLEVPWGGNPPGEAAKNLVRRAAAKRACRHATRIIAVSTHVEKFLRGRWGLPSEKIGVVYHGVEGPDDAPTPMRPAGLPDPCPPFVFAAGSIRPARGLRDLIEALPHLRAFEQPTNVVIAGSVDPAMERHARQLAERAHSLGVAKRLIWSGPLSEAEMNWCYQSSVAFVMTSRAEACPNIALEAMSFGCACVSVDHPPMPEFFAAAARYYRAGDAVGLSRALLSVLSEGRSREELRFAARVRARSFKWSTTTDRTVAQFRLAAESRARPRMTALQRPSG